MVLWYRKSVLWYRKSVPTSLSCYRHKNAHKKTLYAQRRRMREKHAAENIRASSMVLSFPPAQSFGLNRTRGDEMSRLPCHRRGGEIACRHENRKPVTFRFFLLLKINEQFWIQAHNPPSHHPHTLTFLSLPSQPINTATPVPPKHPSTASSPPTATPQSACCPLRGRQQR